MQTPHSSIGRNTNFLFDHRLEAARGGGTGVIAKYNAQLHRRISQYPGQLSVALV